MRHIFAVFLFILANYCQAETRCLLIEAQDKRVYQQGNCQQQVTPASTFKVALSLMGYDSGLLEDSQTPRWDYKADQYPEAAELTIWLQAYTPQLWLQNSCVWYSQELTQKMGLERFQSYLGAFEYGNQDASGNPGKEDGLTQAWLSSSLQISPEEQLAFLKKLTSGHLPVSKAATHYTRENMHYTEIAGYPVFGKTGMGYQTQEGSVDRSQELGWFIGWLEREGKPIHFVHLLEKPPVPGEIASYIARDQVLALLSDLVSGKKSFSPS